MEIQVRIAIETAQMLELLKQNYQAENEINYTKGEVLSKAINDTYDNWDHIDWNRTLKLMPLKTNLDEYEINAGSLRPKFIIANSIATKLDELREKIKLKVGARSVTIGAAIKFIFIEAIYAQQHATTVSVTTVITETLDAYLANDPSTTTKAILEKYTNQLLTKLELNDLL